MTCTKCGRRIEKGEKFYRTVKGPHHESCSGVCVKALKECVDCDGCNRMILERKCVAKEGW